MTLIFSVIISSAVGVGGYFFTKWYFGNKDNEATYSRKKRIIFAIVSVVFFLAIGVCFPLFTDFEERTSFEVLRSVTAVQSLYYIALLDHKFRVIPNKYLLALLGITVVLLGAEAVCDFSGFRFTVIFNLIGSFVCGTIFLITNLLSHNGLGMGDVKLMYVLGLLVGMDDALGALLWTFALSAVYGIVMLIGKKVKMKTKIAMGPFFFLGFLCSNIMYIISGYFGG